MKILSNTLYYLAVGGIGLIGLLLVSTMMPIPGNFEVKVVKSGSMEPTIQVGSVVVIKPASSYRVGDIVTFGADTKTQIPTTHRIISQKGEGSGAIFSTKGDANDTEDQNAIPVSDIHGKMVFTVPYVGYALAFARTKLGFFLLVGVPALIVFFEEGRNIYLQLRRMRMRRRRKEQQHDVPTRMESVAEISVRKAYVQRPNTMSDVRTKKVMGMFAIFTAISIATAGGVYGNTLAYYANSAVSQGNLLRAGAFNLQTFAPPEVSLLTSVVEFSDSPVVEEPPVVVDDAFAGAWAAGDTTPVPEAPPTDAEPTPEDTPPEPAPPAVSAFDVPPTAEPAAEVTSE